MVSSGPGRAFIKYIRSYYHRIEQLGVHLSTLNLSAVLKLRRPRPGLLPSMESPVMALSIRDPLWIPNNCFLQLTRFYLSRTIHAAIKTRGIVTFLSRTRLLQVAHISDVSGCSAPPQSHPSRLAILPRLRVLLLWWCPDSLRLLA